MRPYDEERDWPQMLRVWHEVHWSKPDAGEEHDEALRLLLRSGRCQCIEVDGEVEAFALSGDGSIRYLKETLPLHAVQAVCTSRVARKQGYAARLTADAVATAAEQGAAVSALGFFEQGFYDQLGFGTLPPQLRYRFDPAQLTIRRRHRPPKRIARQQYETVHASRFRRMHFHGGVDLTPSAATLFEMAYWNEGFSLGYFDGPGGELTHHMFISHKDAEENGPYEVHWMVYQTTEQLAELLSLLQSMGDQIRAVTILEPPGFRMQDLIDRPLQAMIREEGAELGAKTEALAWQAIRINNLQACLDKTHLHGQPLRFNLNLHDAVENYLDASRSWRGIGGSYIVELGGHCNAQPGNDASLPTLEAGVSGFSRLWFGSQRARSLAVSGAISGPPELLEALEEKLQLPVPHFDWEF